MVNLDEFYFIIKQIYLRRLAARRSPLASRFFSHQGALFLYLATRHLARLARGRFFFCGRFLVNHASNNFKNPCSWGTSGHCLLLFGVCIVCGKKYNEKRREHTQHSTHTTHRLFIIVRFGVWRASH